MLHFLVHCILIDLKCNLRSVKQLFQFMLVYMRHSRHACIILPFLSSSTAFLQHTKKGVDQYLSLCCHYKPLIILPFQLAATQDVAQQISEAGSYNCSCNLEKHAIISRVPLHSVIFTCFYTTPYVALKQVLLLLWFIFPNTARSSMVRQQLIKFHCLEPFGKTIFVTIAMKRWVTIGILSIQFTIAHILTRVPMPFTCY